MSGHGQPFSWTAAGGKVKGGPKAARRHKMKGAPRGRAAEALDAQKEKAMQKRKDRRGSSLFSPRSSW